MMTPEGGIITLLIDAGMVNILYRHAMAIT